MKSDVEIKSNNEDVFDIASNVDQFIKHYLKSEYYGSLLLNGKWGIGKTSYLYLIKEKVRNDKNIKFVDINFWSDPWIDKPFELIMKKLYPVSFYIIKFLPILMVLVLALGQFFIVLLYESANSLAIRDIITWIILFLVISLLNVTIDKFSTETVYEWLLNLRMKKKETGNKTVFILDDFDRLEENDRKNLYRFMSKINSFDNSLIIAVGEYKRIAKDKESSLLVQKLLANIEYMPVNYDSLNVWNYLEKEIQKSIEMNKITDSDREEFDRLRDTFVDEKRTIREAKQLNNLFERKYLSKKLKNVNSSQQLALCYLYQFHNRTYEWISEHLSIVFSMKLIPHKNFYSLNVNEKEKIILGEELKKSGLENIDTKICEFIYHLFRQYKHEQFGFPSISNKNYYSRYQIENIYLEESMSIEDVRRIFIDEDSYIERLLEVKNKNQMEEFYDLMRMHYFSTTDVKGTDLEKYISLAENLVYMMIETPEEDRMSLTTSIINSIFYKTKEVLEHSYKIASDDIYIKIVMDNKKLDLSEKLLVLPRFVSAQYVSGTEKLIEIVRNLFQKNYDFTIFNQKLPRTCFKFYSLYQSEVDSEKIHYKKFNKLFELQNDKFYEYLKDNLSHKIIEYGQGSNENIEHQALNINAISYNEEYTLRLEQKINTLSKENQKYINSMIEAGEKFR